MGAISRLTTHDFSLSTGHCLRGRIGIPGNIPLSDITAVRHNTSIHTTSLSTLMYGRSANVGCLGLNGVSSNNVSSRLPGLSTLSPGLRGCYVHSKSILVSGGNTPFGITITRIPRKHGVLTGNGLCTIHISHSGVSPCCLTTFFSDPSNGRILTQRTIKATVPGVPIDTLSVVGIPLRRPRHRGTMTASCLTGISRVGILGLHLFHTHRRVTSTFSKRT